MIVDFIARLIVAALAAMPIIDLRGAIAYGIFGLHIPAMEVYILSFLGNIIPIYLLLKYLDPIVKLFFRISPFLHGHILKYFEKLHKKHSDRYNKIGAVFLALFIIIPFPGTGTWSAAALAYLLNIPNKLSVPWLTIGTLGSVITTALFISGGIKVWHFFF